MNFPLDWITSLIKNLLYSARASTPDFNQCHLINESLLSFKIYLILNNILFNSQSTQNAIHNIDWHICDKNCNRREEKTKQKNHLSIICIIYFYKNQNVISRKYPDKISKYSKFKTISRLSRLFKTLLNFNFTRRTNPAIIQVTQQIALQTHNINFRRLPS